MSDCIMCSPLDTVALVLRYLSNYFRAKFKMIMLTMDLIKFVIYFINPTIFFLKSETISECIDIFCNVNNAEAIDRS